MTKPTKEQLEAYKAMAKASQCSMEAMIKDNLQRTCDKYLTENGIILSPMYTKAGMSRTGCMFCPVPIAHGDYKNIEYARIHHQKMYETMMIKHGLNVMLEKVRNTNGQMNFFSEDKQ